MSELALELIEKEIKERTGKLDLGNCGLTTIPKKLLRLSWLKELSLGFRKWDNLQNIWIESSNKGRYNQIKDISFLGKLTSLQSLALRSNHIRDISFIEKLTSLQSLDLSINHIIDINFLGKLTSLQFLDLSTNQISDIRCLESLSSLKTLYLCSNRISDIRFLEKMTSIRSLDLRSNRISDILSLEKLTSLVSLDLRYNEISDIRFLEKLTLLQSLYLSSNQISDIRFLEKLTSLQSLYLNSNQICDIRFLENLTDLQSLDLRSNRIRDIRFLEKLTLLQSLTLSSNQISDIYGLIPILKQGIQVNLEKWGGRNISLYNNPITKPPMNIVEQGSDAILSYFEQLEKQGKENLYEARIVIVGESGAGKTTLFRKFENVKTMVPDPEQKSTHGININYQRIFKHRDRKDVEIKTTIWDFGGQDIQTYLHQYFFAKDNLFILVCDHRSEKTRFDYWFEMITRLCEDSRIVVVRNKKERETASQVIKVDEYQKRFPGLHLSCIDVDLKNTDYHWRSLIQTIEENLAELKRVNEVVPRTWKPIREKIQELKEQDKHYIRISEFQSICEEAGLPEENYQNQCLDYLHWLGYALHYGDSGLSNTIFIDPQWITTGLYEILVYFNQEVVHLSIEKYTT